MENEEIENEETASFGIQFSIFFVCFLLFFFSLLFIYTHFIMVHPPTLSPPACYFCKIIIIEKSVHKKNFKPLFNVLASDKIRQGRLGGGGFSSNLSLESFIDVLFRMFRFFQGPDIFTHGILKLRRHIDNETAGMVVFVFMFVVISIFSFVPILVRIILNVSLLKSPNPAQNLSSFLTGTDH